MANFKKPLKNCWTINTLATVFGVSDVVMRTTLGRPEFEQYRIRGLARPYRYSNDPVFLHKLYQYLKWRYRNVSLKITLTDLCGQEESNIELKQLS